MTIHKYAIDSQGTVHNTNGESKIDAVISAKKRLQIMWQTTAKLVPIYQKNGFDVALEKQKEIFDYLFQPYGAHEYILMFTKTPLLSTSNEVKLAYIMNDNTKKAELLKTNIANGLKTNFTNDMLKSIVKDNHKENLWYLVNVIAVKLERNKFDGQIIYIGLEKIVPYYTFISSVKKDLIKIEKSKVCEQENLQQKYYFYSPSQKDLFSGKTIIDAAVEIKDCESKYNNLAKDLCKLFESYSEKHDKYSNQRTGYINYIICNPQKKIFPIYDKFKAYLKANFKDIRTIQYNKNCITFYFGTYGKQYVYACSYKPDEKKDEPYKDLFILNGHSYNNIQDLQDALKNHESSKCLIPEPSFVKGDTDIIKFYFERTK